MPLPSSASRCAISYYHCSLLLFTTAAHRRLSTGKLTSRGLPSLFTCCHSLCRLALSVPRIMNSDCPFSQREPALCYDTANGTLTSLASLALWYCPRIV